ncbi:MAG: isochorismatase family protein, partial [Bacteroidota bacterium]|nr:isochorismatase family protein [Bacteroidota bacterium]
LLIIDMQNDFCKPDGALYVNGAESDVARLERYISANTDRIGQIVLTQDNHHVIDISHPGFWEDPMGNIPLPFTIISAKDVGEGKWKPRFWSEEAVKYIHDLESQCEFPHTIWPEHCIIGSTGAAIVDEIMNPVRKWAGKGHFFDLIVKGTNPLTEHFGALMANIPVSGSPETQLNTDLVKKLRQYDRILIAGEARSHCVATTVKQLLNIGGFATRMVILEDCMSDVTGFETLALPIYERAKEEGVKFVLSEDI